MIPADCSSNSLHKLWLTPPKKNFFFHFLKCGGGQSSRGWIFFSSSTFPTPNHGSFQVPPLTPAMEGVKKPGFFLLPRNW